ncbi:preprotein translocase subunit YajC [Telmatospirillum siberiense]|uniref:Sec translocon accessory complex subunit YajC n=1 Tax=Telmatospirillum siberiense TaxID=382514 RepID=A0A2N3PTH6_9PROT|nr:preprotein translocase subunit YajC [Telmatospirillum siberiense]PKU23699.1 preprotein translocase subunit YajC [Telmatospirillum siberiense]
MFISEAYAQAAGGSAGGLESLQQFLPLVLIFVVFYFLLLRPQQKKMKAHREMVSQLRRGDRVLTQGGIIGQINKVISETEVSVEIADGVRVRVIRSAISEVLAKTEPVSGASKDAASKDEAKEEGEAAAEGVEAAPPAAKKTNLLGKLLGKN